MAGGVLARAVGFGNDADVLGLDAEGDDLAGELVRAGLLGGADGRHDSSACTLFRARTIAVSDGDRGVADLRPDQPIEEADWSGRPDRDQATENVATSLQPPR